MLFGGGKTDVRGRGEGLRKLARTVVPTGRERTFGEDDIIVSKTDTKGRITYANDVFLRVAAMSEGQALGAPHSLIRHPDMPRAVFRLLWETIASGREIFAYVVNLAADGDHYWVFAHVTPSFGPDSRIIGYHSNRRSPDRRVLPIVTEIYARLKSEEDRHANRAQGLDASTRLLDALLREKGMPYDELVFAL